MRQYLTETIGTFFLVLTAGMSAMRGHPMAPLAIGSALMVMVYMGGHISGGHYNPAVTLAVALRGKLPMKQLAPYWISQFAGALLAALAVYFIMDETFAPVLGGGVSPFEAVAVEFLFTFALALVVLQTATSARTQGNSYYGLAIGFTVFTAGLAGGGISGGAFNPAAGSSFMIVDALLAHGPMQHVWIYLVGPLLGGAAAATVFKMQGGDA